MVEPDRVPGPDEIAQATPALLESLATVAAKVFVWPLSRDALAPCVMVTPTEWDELLAQPAMVIARTAITNRQKAS